MRLTKLGHACVRLDNNGGVLVIDPGAFSGPDTLAGADAVLITHEHIDHVDPDTLRTAMTASPDLRLWACSAVASQFTDFGERARAVAHGDEFTAAGFSVHVYGEKHAPVHPDIPVVENVGFLVDGELFHPGDSYTVPEDPVGTLLLPVSGPWLKISEMIDYGRAVAPRRAYAIHDALLSPIGLRVTEQFMALAAGQTGAPFTRLEPGATADL
jgi:L-ascorbate metabolism protein UlaG (beta-lactamase superfamily)